MTPTEIIAILGALVSMGCAIGSYVRTGRWRETDDAKQLVQRIDALEKRIALIEARDKDLPTKADLAALSGDVRLVKQLVERAEKGIDRIEAYMMQPGR